MARNSVVVADFGSTVDSVAVVGSKHYLLIFYVSNKT